MGSFHPPLRYHSFRILYQVFHDIAIRGIICLVVALAHTTGVIYLVLVSTTHDSDLFCPKPCDHFWFAWIEGHTNLINIIDHGSAIKLWLVNVSWSNV